MSSVWLLNLFEFTEWMFNWAAIGELATKIVSLSAPALINYFIPGFISQFNQTLMKIDWLPEINPIWIKFVWLNGNE